MKFFVRATLTRLWRFEGEVEAESEEEAEEIVEGLKWDDPRLKEDLDGYNEIEVREIDEVEEKEKTE